MPVSCRFCHRKTVFSLYLTTNSADSLGVSKDPNLFTCTNCGFGVHGSIVKCSSCHIIYVDEEITQSQISTYYEVAKDPLYFAEQGARKRTFSGYLNRLEKLFPSKGKLLDIGTNTGLFIRLALDSGWEAFGLEPNRWAAEFALKNYKVKLINKPFEKNIFPNNNFDVITLWDVIEHFTDPVSELVKIYNYLKPGGVLAFTTVNPESLFAKAMGTKWSWYMEMHKVFFSETAAKYYLRKVGFKNIIFKPHFRFLSLGYLSTRLAAINPLLSTILLKIVGSLSLSKIIVPYYANDLFDCYAVK